MRSLIVGLIILGGLIVGGVAVVAFAPLKPSVQKVEQVMPDANLPR
ncbi:MAG: hypothetical protein HGA90_00465 [Alphaproteobacteria bacterium]|nr:hypothetical protein [Alphaproteobacteria bacterium]